jgi:hypothetical protein
MTDLPGAVRGTARTGALVGASSALFAVTLAGVAALQQAAEDGTAAARAPALAVIDRRSADVDAVVAALDAGARAELVALERYAQVVGRLDALEVDLAALDGAVAAVAGAAAALPDRVRLPALRAPRPVQRAPATHATTGASGAP